MAETENIALPLMMPSQAQKHVTHNEALTLLDSLVQLSVRTHTVGEPPIAVEAGERFVIPADAAAGAWEGHGGEIAVFRDGGWDFIPPAPGFRAWSEEGNAILVHTGTGWQDLSTTLTRLGVNATVPAPNRFAVAGEASLLTHEGAGHRLAINKAGQGDSASVVFQTGFSGRAEFGLAGSDDLTLKTSADGTEWREGLVLDRTSGRVRFPGGTEHAATRAPLNGLVFTPGGDGVVSLWRCEGPRDPNPRTAILAGVSGDLITLDAGIDSRFGRWQGYMENVARLRIWNVSKAPEEPAWVVASPSASQLQVLDAAAMAGWSPGDTLRLGEPSSVAPVSSIALDPAPMLQAVLGTVFPQAGLMLKCSSRGNGAAAQLSVSGSGVSGSFLTVSSLPDGSIQTAMFTIPCSVPSPVSEANLLFVAEAGALDISLASVMGVHA